MKVTLVVAGCIVSERGGILIGRREYGPPETIGKWEMIGGVVEEGETLRDALEREVKEESELIIEVKDLLHAQVNRYSDQEPYLVLFFHCRILAGNIPVGTENLRWIIPSELKEYETLPGAKETLDRLVASGNYR